MDSEKCKWEIYGADYRSGCGYVHIFLGGSTPKENEFRYCPYCGKEIENDD